MGNKKHKRLEALERRIISFNNRNLEAKQAAGSDKIASMMHKPGSQNRKKGYSVLGPM